MKSCFASKAISCLDGKASYLEVLTAQESLLDAQLGQAMNMYEAAEAVIVLYIALGGGSE